MVRLRLKGEEKRAAAIKIQAYYRGRIVRKRLSELTVETKLAETSVDNQTLEHENQAMTKDDGLQSRNVNEDPEENVPEASANVHQSNNQEIPRSPAISSKYPGLSEQDMSENSQSFFFFFFFFYLYLFFFFFFFFKSI